MSAFICSRCNRSLVKPAVQSGGLVLGPVCARKLGREITAEKPRKPAKAAKAPPREAQLDLFAGASA